MASKRGQRRRICDRKKHYATEREATRAAHATQRISDPDDADGLHAFACPRGDGWVVGHAPGTKMARPHMQKAIARGRLTYSKKGRR